MNKTKTTTQFLSDFCQGDACTAANDLLNKVSSLEEIKASFPHLMPFFIPYLDSLFYASCAQANALSLSLINSVKNTSISVKNTSMELIPKHFLEKIAQQSYYQALISCSHQDLQNILNNNAKHTNAYSLATLVYRERNLLPLSLKPWHDFTQRDSSYDTLFIQCQWVNNLIDFFKKKSTLHPSIAIHNRSFYPRKIKINTQSLTQFESLQKELLSQCNTPLICLVEPLCIPWEELPIIPKNRPCLFIFPTKFDFMHALSNASLCQWLGMKNTRLLFLDIYPQEQITYQLFKDFNCPSKMYSFCTEQSYLLYKDIYANYIEPWIRSYSQKEHENKTANRLYAQGLLLSRINRSQYLTDKHNISYTHINFCEDRANSYQTAIFNMHYNGWVNQHLSLSRIIQQPNLYKKRERSPSIPINVMHVIPYVDPHLHAPTKRLLNLLSNYDTSLFCPQVITFASRNTYVDQEYPLHTRGINTFKQQTHKKLIPILKDLNIPYHVLEKNYSYELSTTWIQKNLYVEDINVTILHDWDPIYLYLLAQPLLTKTLYMEHGTPLLPFHLVHHSILSHHEELSFHKEIPNISANPVAINFDKKIKSATSLQRSLLNIPEEACLFISITHRPKIRLSYAFCLLLAKLLQANPQAYYLVVGSSNLAFWQKEIFISHRVLNRIRIVPKTLGVFSYLNMADVYLNQFPFGGGLACLEALACKLPMVNLFSKEGSIDCREGAYYFGLELATNTEKEYYTLALKLSKYQQLRSLYAEYAAKAYLRRKDENQYAQRHQTILQEVYSLDKVHAK